MIGAHSQLKEAAWEAAFAEGRNMGLEDIVEYALSEEEPNMIALFTPGQGPVRRSPTLSRREKEIAILVARGMTNRQIAADLTISEHTAATHVRRILKKLGISSRSQLSTWVAEQGLTSSDSLFEDARPWRSQHAPLS